jgi:hypothetical protein
LNFCSFYKFSDCVLLEELKGKSTQTMEDKNGLNKFAAKVTKAKILYDTASTHCGGRLRATAEGVQVIKILEAVDEGFEERSWLGQLISWEGEAWDFSRL